MKNSSNSILRCKEESFVQRHLWFGVMLDIVLVLCAIALITLLLT
jgi:hypothetical protein